jgi:hypothetical protein
MRKPSPCLTRLACVRLLPRELAALRLSAGALHLQHAAAQLEAAAAQLGAAAAQLGADGERKGAAAAGAVGPGGGVAQ